jgi:hypothetical protein
MKIEDKAVMLEGTQVVYGKKKFHTVPQSEEDPLLDEDLVRESYLPFCHKLIHVQDQKATGTQGGAFNNGAWRTRTLNTILTNEISGASLAANQITLPSGTYYIEASAPAFRVSRHKALLYNITDAANEIIGTSEISLNTGSYATTRSFIYGRFTIQSSKVFEIQHRGVITRAVDGFGLAFGVGGVIEVYTDVKIWKVG